MPAIVDKKQAMSLRVDEIDTYANGLLADIEAVKNAIQYKYNSSFTSLLNLIPLNFLSSGIFVLIPESLTDALALH